MRWLALAASFALAPAAHGEPARWYDPLEVSGYIGADDLDNPIGLGRSTFPDQRPQTTGMFGARATYLLAQNHVIELAVEAALALAPAATDYSMDGSRASYFAPIIHTRADVMVRGVAPWIQPLVFAGLGTASVIARSPFMRSETVREPLWGLGVTVPLSDVWRLRVDAVQTILPAFGRGPTTSYELAFGLTARLGYLSPRRHNDREEAQITLAVTAGAPDPDTDRGAPVVLGGDGPDRDGDGIPDAIDTCPDVPEDKDGFQDADGCPDPDNDRDGIPDNRDACPNEPETYNGWRDDDGCPDTVPTPISSALVAASAVRFEPGKSKLTDADTIALEHALGVLRQDQALHVQIMCRAPAGDGDLAQRRADAVLWYLVEHGVSASQLTTASAVDPTATGESATAIIELSLIAQRSGP